MQSAIASGTMAEMDNRIPGQYTADKERSSLPYYNKLVRDRIPDIIEASGKKCTTAVLGDAEYLKQLEKKLSEEWNEYLTSKDVCAQVEELADILEVIYAIAEAKGVTIEELEAIRAKKAEERGAFKERILLEWVED